MVALLHASRNQWLEPNVSFFKLNTKSSLILSPNIPWTLVRLVVGLHWDLQ